jgi:hypothetical protein
MLDTVAQEEKRAKKHKQNREGWNEDLIILSRYSERSKFHDWPRAEVPSTISINWRGWEGAMVDETGGSEAERPALTSISVCFLLLLPGSFCSCFCSCFCTHKA